MKINFIWSTNTTKRDLKTVETCWSQLKLYEIMILINFQIFKKYFSFYHSIYDEFMSNFRSG